MPAQAGKSGELGNLIPGKFCHLEGNFVTWREILVNEIKKYIRNGGKFCYTEGKFWTIFPGNVAFFPAVLTEAELGRGKMKVRKY